MIITDGVHLMSDAGNLDELHKFAQKMGLKREWFQDKKGHPHYDLTTPRASRRAVSSGAKLVSLTELVRATSTLIKARDK